MQSAPSSGGSGNLHAEGFIAFLETAGGEESQRVDVLAEDEATSLTDAEGEGRHELFALDVREGRFTAHAVDEQLSVKRKTCTVAAF